MSAVQRLSRVTVVIRELLLLEGKACLLCFSLERFLTCMVYTTYVIMNYLFILYGLLGGSIDALHR